MTSATFIQWLLHNTQMKEIELASINYPAITRYIWGHRISPVLVALSAKRKSYLSHGSALWVHGVGGRTQQIYVNHEQTEKLPNAGRLTQESIHLAFRNRPRHSKLIYQFAGAIITVINGKQTGRLGVQQILSPDGDVVEATSLERTLIDVTVRPNYAGGAIKVLQVFRAARDRVSVKELARLLKKLDYTYPYHQAVGFYLKRSGYTEAQQDLFARLGAQFDFYLYHGIDRPKFDPLWRVYYPESWDRPAKRKRA